MARFSRLQRCIDCSGIPHFTDKNNVGILTQGRPKGNRKAFGVRTDLTLNDRRLLFLLKVFDGVLNRYNLARLRLVDLVDHRGKGCRLAAARNTGHQDKSPFLKGDLADDLGQTEGIDCGNRERNDAKNHGERASLAADIHAKAGYAGDGI